MIVFIVLALLGFAVTSFIYFKKDNGLVKSLVTGTFWGGYLAGFAFIIANF